MRILITGNMGYVGPLVVAQLRRRYPQAQLVGVDRGWFAHCLTEPLRLPEVLLDQQWFGDVRDLTAEQLRGFDAVVHLAAISNDAMGNRFEQVTDAINHRASVQLARAASEAGVRHFVFASSCSVYGAAADGTPRDEHSALAPLTAYARSKIDTERALAGLHTDMVVTCLRFATACGASPRLRLDLVLNDFVASALVHGRVDVLSDGTPWRPLIHVRDMARAIEWALSREPERGGRYLAVNAGSAGWNVRIRDLAEAVGAAIPGVEVRIADQAPLDARSYRVDFSFYERLAPAHQPAESLGAAIAEIYALLARLGFDDPDFRSSRLVRLRVLQALVDSNALTDQLRIAA
ncbi:SDR family oxidoreductase [Xanthomonas hyacinthi]|uniref:NAD-dependent epimerase/dehydratase n=1 Tax=Xanthomonas hyacinthi TaxID=56455 RepID=A0A2S7ET88_9XANT|nr:SDR family oxidoreductase [Xanthomonas hyacinthi]KLD75731.1 NAD-dependent epimerase [Xanthomonas hyacinthi DSM 19077]PPU96336.1 NAD-dependent epimerase/dehydratase [Xanthomonas hyacinthi]QGY77855.1 SDR family oxidoreductase [Xanthomonas hyacinthi]